MTQSLQDKSQDASATERPSEAAIDLKEAIQRAKNWLISTLSGENVSNLGLEEVEHHPGYWNITLGFSRPWDEARTAVTVLSGAVVMRRTYKVITIDERSGDVVAMKDRSSET